MSRVRTLKPGFFKNEELAKISYPGRLLFQGLWCLADRMGRLEDRPQRIKIEILPYDDCDVDALLQRLHDLGFISRYSVNNQKYISVINFQKHQKPHTNESESEIPPPPQNGKKHNQGSTDLSPWCENEIEKKNDHGSAHVPPRSEALATMESSTSLLILDPDPCLLDPDPDPCMPAGQIAQDHDLDLENKDMVAIIISRLAGTALKKITPAEWNGLLREYAITVLGPQINSALKFCKNENLVPKSPYKWFKSWLGKMHTRDPDPKPPYYDPYPDPRKRDNEENND